MTDNTVICPHCHRDPCMCPEESAAVTFSVIGGIAVLGWVTLWALAGLAARGWLS